MTTIISLTVIALAIVAIAIGGRLNDRRAVDRDTSNQEWMR